MLKNYLKIALRNLRKHRSYTLINVLGLAVGMGCCLLIGLYVEDELSYDQYHERADRIVRVHTASWAMVPASTAPALTERYGHLVEDAARFWPMFAPAKMRHDETVFVEKNVAFGDPGVLRVFTYPLRAGNPATALDGPDKVVLTASMAKKYFGDEPPLGRSLEFWGRALEVTGVMDNVPQQSHYRFDFLVSLATLYAAMGADVDRYPTYTYVLLQENATAEQVAAILPQVYPRLPDGSVNDPEVMALTDLHLQSTLEGEPGPRGNIAYLMILVTAALFVLMLACVNFINLATARSALRAREVGLRKTLGAGRWQLIGQFLSESVALSLIALGVAVLLVELSLPVFNHIAGKQIVVDYVDNTGWLVGLVGLGLIVGLVAGSYPALVLTRFQPARVLKGGAPPAAGAALRKGLVVFQFGMAVFLLIGVGVVARQLDYLQSKDVGYEREHVMVLDGDRFPLMKEALRDVPGVIEASASMQTLGDPVDASLLVRSPEVGIDSVSVRWMGVREDFAETLDINMIEGRGFSEARGTHRRFAREHGDENELLVNQAAVKALGGGPMAGRVLDLYQRDDGSLSHVGSGTVVGVMDDFNYTSLHATVDPLMLVLTDDINLTYVRLNEANLDETLAQVEAVWKTVNPDAPFNAYFLDDYLKQAYRAEAQLSQVLGGFTVMALLVACLGLFGLTAFTTARRTKEIGVRKVLGASLGQVMLLLLRNIVSLVLVAVLVAAPLAYVAMDRWLSGFAYHVDLGVGTFLLAGGLVLAVAVLTVSYQSVRAALADPVDALRYE